MYLVKKKKGPPKLGIKPLPLSVQAILLQTEPSTLVNNENQKEGRKGAIRATSFNFILTKTGKTK